MADLELMEQQWRKLLTLNYVDICPSVPIQDIDSSVFWINVLNINDSSGKQAFKDLAEFSLRVLSLPLANAIVERVFSIMNSVKTKARNRMQMSTLEAVLKIKL